MFWGKRRMSPIFMRINLKNTAHFEKLYLNKKLQKD